MTNRSSRSALSALAFATVLVAGLAPSSFSVAAASAAVLCPPSEGELDFGGYELSGDGLVQLPEGVRWRVIPAETSRGVIDTVKRVCGVGGGDAGRVTLVLEDPSRENQRLLTMRLTALAASEVKEWLDDAVTAQTKFVADKTYAEKPGMQCTADAKQCKAAADKGQTRIDLPRMYVSVSSGAGQHGWSMIARGQDAQTKTDDQRITITTYTTREEVVRPLAVKMDVPTARKLLADITTAMQGKTPEPPKDAKPEREDAKKSAA